MTFACIDGFYLTLLPPCWCTEQERTKSFGKLTMIMQNVSHNLLLFCARTRSSYHVIENRLFIAENGVEVDGTLCDIY